MAWTSNQVNVNVSVVTHPCHTPNSGSVTLCGKRTPVNNTDASTITCNHAKNVNLNKVNHGRMQNICSTTADVLFKKINATTIFCIMLGIRSRRTSVNVSKCHEFSPELWSNRAPQTLAPVGTTIDWDVVCKQNVFTWVLRAILWLNTEQKQNIFNFY